MQQILNTKCKLSFGDYPEEAGNFEVLKGNNSLKKSVLTIQERKVTYQNFPLQHLKNSKKKVNNINTVLNDIASERTSNEVWKWFIIATLLFFNNRTTNPKICKMTQVILKQAKIIDASSPFHKQVMDIKIENGTITNRKKKSQLLRVLKL